MTKIPYMHVWKSDDKILGRQVEGGMDYKGRGPSWSAKDYACMGYQFHSVKEEKAKNVFQTSGF
jgi:hypothetical protein